MATFVHYTPQPVDDDGALVYEPLDADILAIFEALEARAVAHQARLGAQLEPLARASAAMARWAAELLSGIKAWAWEHYDAAQPRSLPASADAFAKVAEAVEGLQDTLEDRGLSPSIAWGARKAYEAAFSIINRRLEAGHFESAAFDQARVAEETPIRELCNVLAFITEQHTLMLDGDLTPVEAQLAAAEALLDAHVAPELDTEQWSAFQTFTKSRRSRRSPRRRGLRRR